MTKALRYIGSRLIRHRGWLFGILAICSLVSFFSFEGKVGDQAFFKMGRPGPWLICEPDGNISVKPENWSMWVGIFGFVMAVLCLQTSLAGSPSTSPGSEMSAKGDDSRTDPLLPTPPPVARVGTISDKDVLDAIGNEIQAEHTLISHRLAWYIASVSFLMGAYAIALGKGHTWPAFFALAVPVLGLVLSALACFGLWAAVWVQWDLLQLKAKVIQDVQTRLTRNGCKEDLARFDAYARTFCGNRPSGHLTHWIAMLAPLLLPVVFLVTWLLGLGLRPALPTPSPGETGGQISIMWGPPR
ncbi:MAG: hypothetical protein ACRCZF_12165 [Gemmataceae bacterium]